MPSFAVGLGRDEAPPRALDAKWGYFPAYTRDAMLRDVAEVSNSLGSVDLNTGNLGENVSGNFRRGAETKGRR